jgi:hypothetical protein
MNTATTIAVSDCGKPPIKQRLTAKQRRERDEAYALASMIAVSRRTIDERAARGEDVSHLSIDQNGRLIDAIAERQRAFDAFVRRTHSAIESCQHTLGRFHAAIDADPSSAMTWGMDAFRAAAMLKVQTIVLRWLDVVDDDAYPNVTRASVVSMITNEFTRDVMREARSPSRSTSPTSNLMEQEILAAKATWLDNAQFWTFG